MSFFDDLGKSLTGQSKTELSQNALNIQEQLAKDTLSAEVEAQKLKYNPELSKQRTIQVAIVAGFFMIAISVFIYIRFLR